MRPTNTGGTELGPRSRRLRSATRRYRRSPSRAALGITYRVVEVIGGENLDVMPSTGSGGRKHRLWGRMLVACVLLAVAGAALLAAEGAFFGAVTYGALEVLTPVAVEAAPDPAAGFVAGVLGYGLLVFVVLGTFRAARESPYGLDFLPDVFVYVPVVMVGASLAVTYWIVLALGLPRWVFGMVVVTLVAMAYPMAGYLLATSSSPTEGEADDGTGDEDSSLPPGGPDPASRPSNRERVRVVAGTMGRMLREAAAALGRAGSGLALVAVPGSLAGLYVAAATSSPDSLVVPVTVAASCLLVALHVVGLVRAELDDAAVLRELDGRLGEATGRDGDTEAPDRDGDAEGSDGRDVGALQARVDRLAAQADVPAPDVRLVRSATPTAATAGYRPAASTVVVTTGLVETLADDELDAVLAHELAHVANRDAAVLTALTFPRIAARSAFVRYGFNPVMALFAGLVSLTSRCCGAAVARAREYAADDGAVAVTGDPAALASALERLDDAVSRRPAEDLRTAAAAFAIVPPPWEERRFWDRTYRLRARTREQERR